MVKKRRIFLLAALLLCLLALGHAAGEEAENITGQCHFRLCSTQRKYTTMTDGKYTTYWESNKIHQPWVAVESEKPIHGLYLCFRKMPDSFVIQVGDGENWKTVLDGDTRFQHTWYELDGVYHVRVLSTDEKKLNMGFNEIFVFGEGETPSWVQRWEEPEEKADVMFVMAHPDDELLFLGGAIPTYDTEMGKRVVVAYLSWSNTTRRSEALNGLWAMGVRHYPEFGGFTDSYSSKVEQAYKKLGEDKVLAWVTELFRKYRPEVVVTHDLEGEYGHGQHKMIADACVRCYDLAADGEQYPESANSWGAWQVRKLYVHLYGDEAERTQFDWNVPLASFGGKTGLEVAIEGYAQHKTQEGKGIKIRGKFHRFSVEETGTMYPNTSFGLYDSTVGPDETHTDFLEHIDLE